MGFGSISTDLYLPAMPAMARALNAGSGGIEHTISGYLLGFSLGQLFWGPLSDRIGRKLPIALGLMLFILGSSGCGLSQSAWSIIIWRMVQALGASAGVVLARAIVRDMYEGPRAAQMLSTLYAVMAIAPLIGPLVGAQISALAGWRAIFWTLSCIGVTTLCLLALLPETLPAHRRRSIPLWRFAIRYGELVRQADILRYIGIGAFFYAGSYAYIAGSAFAYISYHHVSPTAYALIFGSGIVGVIVSNIVNIRMLRRLDPVTILFLGSAASALFGCWAAVTAYLDWGGVAALVLPLFLYLSTNGLIVSNSIAGALANHPEEAGAVSALVGGLQYGCGLIGAGFVGYFVDGTPFPMAGVIAGCGIGSLLCASLLKRSIRLERSAMS